MKVTISDENLARSLVSAFEGGSNYWACIDQIHCPKPRAGELKSAHKELGRVYMAPFLSGGYLLINDDLDGVCGESERLVRQHRLDRPAIESGLNKLAKNHKKIFGAVCAGEADAGEADAFLQFCLFGEVLYA